MTITASTAPVVLITQREDGTKQTEVRIPTSTRAGGPSMLVLIFDGAPRMIGEL